MTTVDDLQAEYNDAPDWHCNACEMWVIGNVCPQCGLNIVDETQGYDFDAEREHWIGSPDDAELPIAKRTEQA